MVSLTDIAPSFRTVKVGKDDVTVYGISAEGVAYLLTHYPELIQIIGGAVSITPDLLAKTAPKAIASLIAVGCGCLGDGMPKAEQNAARLSVETQLDFLEAIIDATVPGGIAPFVERLGSWLESAMRAAEAAPGGANVAKVQAMTSAKPSTTSADKATAA